MTNAERAAKVLAIWQDETKGETRSVAFVALVLTFADAMDVIQAAAFVRGRRSVRGQKEALAAGTVGAPEFLLN